MDFRHSLSSGSLIHSRQPQAPLVQGPAALSKTRPNAVVYSQVQSDHVAHPQHNQTVGEPAQVQANAPAKNHQWVSAPQHPILGIPTAFLDSEEVSNTILFIATGVFILYVADAFVKVGRRRARADAVIEIMRSQNLGIGSN